MVDVGALALERPATLGEGRLVCIDGPAGSGKTTLAEHLHRTRGAVVVHVDDLLPGWDGLPQVAQLLGPLLRPLADGMPGRYRRYDWVREQLAETVEVGPAPLLVLEGVGSGCPAYADLVTLLVWVEAPPGLRLRRGLERDGHELGAMWEQWMRDEADLFARDDTRERADVRVDGTVPYAAQ